MTLEEKIKKIHELKTIVANKDSEKKTLEGEIKNLNSEIETLTSELLVDLDAIKADTYEVEDLVAYTAVNSSTGYVSEDSVLNYLKENGYDEFIKVTTAIKKKELNAALKTNAALKEAISGFITTVNTRYATVSTKDNNVKRLEHIAESKKGK